MSSMTLVQFIKYIDNAANNVHIDAEQPPSVYKTECNKASGSI